MTDSAAILKLRTLLCFLCNNEKHSTVTNIARVLGQPKYTISRIITELKTEGLIDKSNPRNPILTLEGRKKAQMYQERIEIIINHLMFEGVDIEYAKNDALHWALYNSEQSMEAIRAASERYRIKYELRNKKQFSGATLCRMMQDGVYQFPFIIYRDEVKDGNNISMANDGFEHPCTFCVRKKEGIILLRAQPISMVSRFTGEQKRGVVQNLQYFDSGSFIHAEKNGNIISFPASALQFINIGSGVGQILHGSVRIRMESTYEEMPKSTALFTILI